MKRVTIITIGGLLVVAVLWYLWYAFLQPMFIFAYTTGDIYTGADYYRDDTYLSLEHGKRLENFLTEFGETEKRRVIDFYYEDNADRDSRLYGKSYDVCTIDFVYPYEEYVVLKDKAARQSIDPARREGDYIFFSMNYEEISSKYVCLKAIAFCDKEHIVRYIMIPDADRSDTNLSEVVTIMKWSDYHSWEIDAESE